MKKLALSMAVLAMVGVASADIYLPNGGFDTGDNTDWTEVAGGGLGATYQYPTTGGNPGGYGQIDSTAGAWAIWVASPGGNELIPLSYFGASGGDTITVTMDMVELASGTGAETAGIKMESWTTGGAISDSGDMKVDVGSSWATYTWDYTVEAAATHIKFVPVQHDEISVGYDNIGVVPEPATFGLLGIAGGAMLFMRRRFKK